MAKPRHVPTDRTRAIVEALIGSGATEEYTAKEIGITDRTLRKYYREELDRAFERVNNNLAQTIIRTALRPPPLRDKQGNLVFDTDANGKKVQALDYNSRAWISALIFSVKARCRWRTVHDVNVFDGDKDAAEARDILTRGLDRLAAAYAEAGPAEDPESPAEEGA